MTRYGPQFGPDVTFLGVPRCDLEELETYADADVVILGAPFDGGTSHRPGARFGPMAIRTTDSLPHDGSRPSLALRTDALVDPPRVDAGGVDRYPGHIARALPAPGAPLARGAGPGRTPGALGGARPHRGSPDCQQGCPAGRPGESMPGAAQWVETDTRRRPPWAAG